MINSNKLKGRIRELAKTQEDCALVLNIKAPTFNQKLNQFRSFKLEEAIKLQQFLGIPDEEFREYFFCCDSSDVQREERENTA